MCVQTAEDKIQTPTTETEGDTDDDALVVEEVRESNAYPMITLSVDSETEAEAREDQLKGKEEEDPTAASKMDICSNDLKKSIPSTVSRFPKAAEQVQLHKS